MKIWRNSELIEESVSGFENLWPTGTGIFETLRTSSGKVYEFNRHMRRALNSSLVLGIKLPAENLIRDGVAQLLTSQPQKNGRLRLHFADDFFAASHAPYEELLEEADLISCEFSEKAMQHKMYPYTQRLQLLESAQEQGADDLILWDPRTEMILESSVSNILFQIDDVWVTPPIGAGILPGVVRAVSIERCGVAVRAITYSQLKDVQQAILVSSLKVAQPVRSINGRVLVNTQIAHAMSAQIRANYELSSVG
jgi:branched-chain amino acid aminotransferase